MKTLKVRLKQHTPLIHFQHDQYGATLRASEVKPKLDRFILTKIGNGYYDAGVNTAKNKTWLIGKGEHPALDYKLRIKSSDKKQEYLIASYLSQRNKDTLENRGINVIDQSPFFAQEKENSEIVRGSKSWNDIKAKGIICQDIIVDIYSVHEDLVNGILSEYIQSFFAFENFGMRQDKGFGCFTVESIFVRGLDEEKQIPLKLVEQLFKDNFLIRYKKVLTDNSLSSAFSTISNDYRLLKSGKNKPYAKSKLMLYGLKRNQRWEKKFFKEYIDEIYQKEDGTYYKLKSFHNEDKNGLDEDEDFYYLRALLGLANQYEFLLSNPPSDNKKMIVSIKSDDVERFKSPIIFKVIDGIVYLLGNQISSEILSKKFYFEVNIQGDSGYKDDRIVEDLYTPDKFDLKKFIDFALTDRTNGASLNYIKF
ncbi:hypothetical protein H8784_14530 [Parabacteroides acidifaciens]|uniref:CRISPR-associated protein n=1 Tax=Parabacteroides acidifaciens TaxID=2290935 RepID=A0A3D8HBG9_9BACT|nr:hypothetical protein [Parabacteroides acidifaciens]MBC8602930.1 hypothetical protein [Parabacteroides acidifaciens]RDU48335.1 hypothetical protein DWU89_14905 [Parabacteroides acidifaciens]